MSLDAISAKNQMNEIARMAYGSGIFEGTSGGKGNIGLITGADGQARAIKFNTHSYERGGAATEDQIKSSNALRAQLLTIAESLNSGVMADLRTKLGIKDGEDATSCKTLLTRQVVASALKMIDKNAMSDAMKGVNASPLKSLGGTKFEEARIHADYGISSTTLKKCGMSAADFEEAINAMASKYNLSGAKKQLVGRMTASYMTAIAESGRTGALDKATGLPKEGLPSKEEFKRQISGGTFVGTYMGLIKADKVSPRSPAFYPEDKLLGLDNAPMLNGLSDDECVDAAYFVGKMGSGPRGEAVGDNQVSAFLLKTLIENRTELMAIRQKDGDLSVGTIWKKVAGMEMPERRNNSAYDLSEAVQKKFFDKLVNVEKNPAAIANFGSGETADYEFFSQSIGTIVLSIKDFGVTLDQAVKLVFGQEVKDLNISYGASAYDVSSKGFKDSTEASLIDQIQSDMVRARGDSPFHISDGKTTSSIVYTQENSDDIGKVKTQATTKAQDLMKSMNKLIGGGDEIKKPLLPQFKTMALLCTQAGNNFLSLAGLRQAELDHHPTEKSFTRQEDGSVLFTASGIVNNTKHTISYQINTDGTSSLLEYNRAAAA